MRLHVMRWMCVLMFLLVLALSVGAATVHITYTRPSDGSLIASETTSGSLNLTLPNTSLDLGVESENRTFRLEVPSLSVGSHAVLNLSARDVVASSLYNSTLGLGSSERYVPRLAYAFRIDDENSINGTYTVHLNYSGANVSGSYDLVVFKLGYNFTLNTTDYSAYELYDGASYSHDTTQDVVSFNVTGFSVFVLTEDTSTPTPSPSPGGSPGGGGGGGGTSRSVITVIPVPEGAIADVPRNSIVNVVYDLKNYPLEYTFSNTVYVRLKDQLTGEYITFLKNVPKDLDLDGSGDDDVRVELTSLRTREATFVFTLLKTPVARASVPAVQSPSSSGQDSDVSGSDTGGTGTAADAGADVTGGAGFTSPVESPDTEDASPGEDTVPVPPSVFNLWTLVFALLLIIVLIGGVAAYRRHLSMDKPPAAIRTGPGRPLSETELPPTSERPGSVPDLSGQGTLPPLPPTTAPPASQSQKRQSRPAPASGGAPDQNRLTPEEIAQAEREAFTETGEPRLSENEIHAAEDEAYSGQQPDLRGGKTADAKESKASFLDKITSELRRDVSEFENKFRKRAPEKEPPEQTPEVELVREHAEPEFTVPEERIKKLEKYVYHGLSEGFTPEQMRGVLKKKGWPDEIIERIFEHVHFTDEHIESHDLHTHTETELALDPVKRLLEKGFDEEHIRQGLRRKGWKPEQIDELFSKI